MVSSLLALAATATLSSCATTKRETVAIRPDLAHPQWFVCEPAGTRPHIAPEYQIDWAKVGAATTVPQAVEAAKAEVGKLIATIRTREGAVAGYLLDIEGKLFVCGNNMKTQLDFYKGLGPGGMASRGREGGTVRMVGPLALPGAPNAALAFRS